MTDSDSTFNQYMTSIFSHLRPSTRLGLAASAPRVLERHSATFLTSFAVVLLALFGRAANAQVLVSETFKNSTASGWIIGSDAKLTSGDEDPSGNGYLRLTPNDGNKRGFAIYNRPIPTDAGVKISFDFVSWGGRVGTGNPGADGIAFFLLDGTTPNPQVGAYGGSLGYANRFAGEPGVTNGYVGIGIDEYGNYSNPTEGRRGGPGFTPQSVAIRGSGNGELGYNYLTGTGTLSPTLDQSLATTRPNQAGPEFRRATITIDTLRRITVQIQFGAGTTPVTVINNFDLDTAPGQTALPASFKFGFTSSTGGFKNYHEIRNFVLSTSTPDASTVTGRVYLDANHNGKFDTGTESGAALPDLFAKLVPFSGGNAIAAVPVSTTDGTFRFSGVPANNYNIIIDDNSTLADTTPYLPPGFVGTEAPNQTRTVNVLANNIADYQDQNFGLYAGSRVDGFVFSDTGVGTGGVANNGIKDGTEAGIGGIAVKATDAVGSTTYDSVLTNADGTYTLYIPTAATTVNIVETNANATLSTGAQLGNTGGTYDRALDTITFTPTAGTVYTPVNFGDVPINDFLNDGNTISTPGNAVFYTHIFTAGSGGSVSFSTSSTQTPTGLSWTNVIYRDTNANGLIDDGEPILQPTDSITLAAGEKVFIIVKENVPPEAPLGAKDVLTVSANYTYTNATPALTSTSTRVDTTTVATATGLEIVKSTSAATAAPGQNITYTIAYRNTSDQQISNIVISDFTPGFTTFVAASGGTPPAGLVGPTITSPAVGSTGNITWTFGGTLAPQGSGSVTFTVKVNN